MRFRSTYLPTQPDYVPSGAYDANGWTVEPAPLTPDELRAEVAAAERAAESLRWRPVGSILASLTRVVDHWLAPDSEEFARAVSVLHDVTGFSVPVLRRGLQAHFAALSGDAIGTLLDHELGDRLRLDRDLRRRHFASATHYMAGNLPGLAIWPMLLTLALRSVPLIKSALGDPYLPAALARSIAAIDPELGRCVVVHDWRGGLDPCDFIVDVTPLLVVMGSDETIRFLAARAAGKRGILHGTRISFAVVTRAIAADDAAADAAARELALDMAQWDQFGCLSPQLAFVEADAATFERFAARLGEALDRMSIELPPRRLTLEDRTAIGTFRQSVAWDASGAGDTLLVPPDSTAWSLSLEHTPRFRPSAPNRCARLVRLDRLEQMMPLLAENQRHLECAGIAADPLVAPALRNLLEHAGVPRVCPVGVMQTPTLAWRQGGRPRIADWLRLDEPRPARRTR